MIYIELFLLTVEEGISGLQKIKSQLKVVFKLILFSEKQWIIRQEQETQRREELLIRAENERGKKKAKKRVSIKVLVYSIPCPLLYHTY